MTRMTGGSASVERKIGRAISCPNGDNERPYGKCYGQVCGVSYPCTQQEYIDPKKEALEERKAANKTSKKAEYQSGQRGAARSRTSASASAASRPVPSTRASALQPAQSA